MDHGQLTDNNGRRAFFNNIILIMTTNAGADSLTKKSIGFSNSVSTGDEMVEIEEVLARIS